MSLINGDRVFGQMRCTQMYVKAKHRRCPRPTSITLALLFVTVLCAAGFSYLLKLSLDAVRSRWPAADITGYPSQRIIYGGGNQSFRCLVYSSGNTGRLGNQMFIIASVYGLARLHSCHFYLEPKIIKAVEPIFRLDFSPLLISSEAFRSIVGNKLRPVNRRSLFVVCQYVYELANTDGIPLGSVFELRGYWLSYLHFSKYADEFRQRIFVATQPILRTVSSFFGQLYKENFASDPDFSFTDYHTFKTELARSTHATWIGIHVRRADFLKLSLTSSDAYLFRAIVYYTELYPDAHFIVASDDKRYCSQLFSDQPNIFVTPRSFSFGDDMVALSLCQHSIVTGGTFGWWSAFLANGRVMHDVEYVSECPTRQQYYPPWFLLDGYVRAHKDGNYTL